MAYNVCKGCGNACEGPMHRDPYCIERLQARKKCKGCGGTPAAFNYYVFDYCVDKATCASRLISTQILPFSRDQTITIKDLREVIKQRDDQVIELLQRIRWRDDQIEQLQRRRSPSRSRGRRSRSRSSDRRRSRSRSRSRSSDRHHRRRSTNKNHQTVRPKNPSSKKYKSDQSQTLMSELDEFLAKAKEDSTQNRSQPVVQ